MKFSLPIDFKKKKKKVMNVDLSIDVQKVISDMIHEQEFSVGSMQLHRDPHWLQELKQATFWL